MKKIRVNRRFTNLIIVIISLFLMVGLAQSSYRLWKKQDIVAERQAKLSEVEAEHIALKRRLEEAKTESFVERMAREKLGLVKEGETIVIVDKSQNSNLNDQEKPEENTPNWKRWWALFF